MKKTFRALALMMAVMLAIFSIVGCGGDDDGGEEEAPEVALTGTNPANGGEIAANGTLTMTFDNKPGSVQVNGSDATISGKSATWNATDLTAGQDATLAITWTKSDGTDGGSQSITVKVKAEDTTAPKVTGGTVKNGDQDVDPAGINESREIKIEFDEAVVGAKAEIKPEGGDPLATQTALDGKTLTITLNKGADLGNETTYIITITGAADAAGNALEGGEIKFTTKAKE